MPKKNVYIAVAVAIAVVAIFLLLGFFGMTGTPQAAAPTPANDAQALLSEISATGSVATLQIITTAQGAGEGAKDGDTVTLNYTGVLPDGTVFDSSRTEGRTPISFVLGTGYVIQGWEQGLQGMKVGERRLLAIPGDLAYGPAGRAPTIPPNATLIFDVEMVAITPAVAQ